MSRIELNQTQVTLAAQRKAIPLVRKVARETLRGARRMAPRGDHEHGSGRRVSGPALRASLSQGVLQVSRFSVRTRVGSSRRWAATVHQGSKPHVIRAKGKLLKFRWDRGNLLIRGQSGRRFFFFKKVNHPGNRRPVRYLMTPLIRSGRAAGFRVAAAPRGTATIP